MAAPMPSRATWALLQLFVFWSTDERALCRPMRPHVVSFNKRGVCDCSVSARAVNVVIRSTRTRCCHCEYIHVGPIPGMHVQSLSKHCSDSAPRRTFAERSKKLTTKLGRSTQRFALMWCVSIVYNHSLCLSVRLCVTMLAGFLTLS